MLVSIAVVPYVTVGVVVVDQEIGVVGEDVTRRQVDRRQLDVFRAGDFIYLAGVVGQVAAGFVAQVGRGFAVAGHLHRVVDADRAVVRGDDYRVSAFREQAQQCQQVGVFEPRTGERAERGFVLGEFRG